MKSKVIIYVATHKPYKVLDVHNYVPIQVGAALTNKNFGFLLDNTGMNISDKNRNYCELTALYWIWKNAKEDIVGLCHYRRYFCIDKKRRVSGILSAEQIEKDLEIYDIILPSPYSWGSRSCWEYYYCDECVGRKKDLELLKEVILEDYNDYMEAFEDVMMGNEASYCNMLICRKVLFDQYASWLFEVLEKVESRIDMSGYTAMEARVFGYLSELLLNVWCKKNILNVKYYPIVNWEQHGVINRIFRKVLERLKNH